MKGHWKVVTAVVVVAAISVSAAMSFERRKEHGMSTFVITETGPHTSLDPLDGDSSQNLPVVRMLYATPLEIFADNSLGSRVLEDFEYDRAARTIHWTVRNGVTFSDNSTIAADDVAFAVARMAYTRPNFPLIKLIKGLDTWLKGSVPLAGYPEGIKIQGNKIAIALTEDYPHPLFRFCLELFAIIPKKCVDPATNKIVCESVPTSGYYELKSRGERSLVFGKRPGVELIQNKSYPAQIQFLYRDAKEALEDSSLPIESTVILGSESQLTRSQLEFYESKFAFSYTPAAWFTVLQLNSKVTPFDKVNCRREFAEAFRRNFERLSGKQVEASIFTKIVAGYKTHAELLGSSESLGGSDAKDCADIFKKSKIAWGFDKSTPTTFVDTVIATTNELGIEVNRLEFSNRKEEVDSFTSGKSALTYVRTGFWALDPTGDVQMLFTPNLHKILEFSWADSKLQGLLKTVVDDGEVNQDAVDGMNSYLFSDGKFNVYAHIRRFYAARNRELVRDMPIGITSPSPWHLFGGWQ